MRVSVQKAAQHKPFKVLPYHKIRVKSSTCSEEWLSKEFDKLDNLVHRLASTCLHDDGVGIAAPQVGIFKCIFLIREDEQCFKAYINPHFKPILEGGKAEDMEGCLSVPGRLYKVSRWNRIEATWNQFETSTEAFRAVYEEISNPFLARVYQHEHDHLDGISIADKINSKNRAKKTRKKKRK